MERVRVDGFRLLFFHTGFNKICDRSCQHLCKGSWLLLQTTYISIHFYSSGSCGIREEGCRLMAKQRVYIKFIWCKILVKKVLITKLEWLVTSSWGRSQSISNVIRNTNTNQWKTKIGTFSNYWTRYDSDIIELNFTI